MANQNPVCLVSVWSNIKTYCKSELNQFVCMMHVLCCPFELLCVNELAGKNCFVVD